MKECPDCGSDNVESAVTCAECGSLFGDQVGVDRDEGSLSRRSPVEESALDAAEATETRGSTIVVCRACGAVNSPTQVRCTYCGSNQLSEKSAAGHAPDKRPGRKRVSAWDRRPRIGVVDGEFPDVSPAFVFGFIGIGLVKLLLCTSLGIQIVIGKAGLNGLHPTTFAWKWAIGPALLLDAFLAGVGAIGLFYLRKYGAAVMSASMMLDVLLLSWLVIFNTWGTLNLWPGSGPYFFLACVCVACSIVPIHKARSGHLL